MSRDLAREIYKLTEKFPEKERFGVVNQRRRPAISIGSNLAEGSSRGTSKDRAHFITIAYGSLMEFLNQLILSYDFSFLKNRNTLVCGVELRY